MNALGRTFVLVGAVALAACAGQPAPQPTPPRPTRGPRTRRRSAPPIGEWAGAAQAKDAAKFASFYAEDAVVMMADAPDIGGLPAIRDGIGHMMQDPAFALSFEPENVVVARSGDLAYETGPYSMTMTGPGKKAATEKGHYVVVWRSRRTDVEGRGGRSVPTRAEPKHRVAPGAPLDPQSWGSGFSSSLPWSHAPREPSGVGSSSRTHDFKKRARRSSLASRPPSSGVQATRMTSPLRRIRKVAPSASTWMGIAARTSIGPPSSSTST